jgi:molecular chaperone DnaK
MGGMGGAGGPGGAAGPGAGPDADADDEEYVDADFEDVDDDEE